MLFITYKWQVCTFVCTSVIDFQAFWPSYKTILQHNMNQSGPLSDHPKRDIILPCREDGDCITFDWSMRQTQESGIRRLVLVGCRSFFRKKTAPQRSAAGRFLSAGPVGLYLSLIEVKETAIYPNASMVRGHVPGISL